MRGKSPRRAPATNWRSTARPSVAHGRVRQARGLAALKNRMYGFPVGCVVPRLA
jgi:hypothetical protein